MRPWMNRATLRGRLHGRLLLVLIVVAVLVSAAAVWQFVLLWDDHDPDLAEIDGRETPTVAAPADESESATESASAIPSPTLESSPLEEGATSTPAAIVSQSPAPTTEAAEGPACTASLRLDNEWSESVSVTVTLTNTGVDRIDGWEVLLALEHLDVTSTWGLDHIEGDRYGDIFFNAGIDPGDSVEPSFQADIEGDFTLPATVPCTPA
ncbi:cellulose binding domain-containing protein [Glycomyces sp. TRM65418]|uniref:cellulose binding domain-containing protein n=1 Tax=Glycomyces sp. TRM65418 TaxID=2867006 RepID=UPI001CE57459|nr:cellulose binding domain-containing protein [Glycomyces sp. TRM65418]MCC3765103.1 cellulose binding domain-containing protein [Glycomyces sp. TRM65418]QZD54732.1 cellulose binding domain-containing protein [Glycomyces sp. TRM65418]